MSEVLCSPLSTYFSYLADELSVEFVFYLCVAVLTSICLDSVGVVNRRVENDTCLHA